MKYSTELEQNLHIDSFETSVVSIPFKQSMHLAFGDVSARPSGVVQLKVSSASGGTAVGLGEGVTLPLPLFTDDSGINIEQNTAELLDSITAEHNDQSCAVMIEGLRDYSFKSGGQYPTARLAVEMALLDSYSRLYDFQLQKMLGIEDVSEVPYGKSIGGITEDEIITQANAALSHDAKKIKLKVMPDNFEAVIRAIKNLGDLNSGIELMVDANGGFDPHDQEHRKMICQLDDIGLVMIEEPVSRIGRDRGLTAVRSLRTYLGNLATPICLDDCLTDYESCVNAVKEGLADVVNIKPGRIGSFISAIELIDYCDSVGKQVMIGGMFEATPGRCLTLMLGAYCLMRGFTIPGDLSLAQERLDGDLMPDVNQLAFGEHGGIAMPSGLGWGY